MFLASPSFEELSLFFLSDTQRHRSGILAVRCGNGWLRLEFSLHHTFFLLIHFTTSLILSDIGKKRKVDILIEALLYT